MNLISALLIIFACFGIFWRWIHLVKENHRLIQEARAHKHRLKIAEERLALAHKQNGPVSKELGERRKQVALLETKIRITKLLPDLIAVVAENLLVQKDEEIKRMAAEVQKGSKKVKKPTVKKPIVH